MQHGAVTIGVDFGTLSGRAVVVLVEDGTELGSAVHEYASGVVEASLPGTDQVLPPSWALQMPSDWRAVLSTAVPEALRRSGATADQVVGIATDFTACTVLPVTASGVPLCELPAFADRPHAYPKLWKHHAAQRQADRINDEARRLGQGWLTRYGGAVSSEWQYAKALQVLEEDPAVYEAMDLWVEAADWIVWQLTGTLARNACTAGYKGIRQDGRYPGAEFLGELHPGFAGFALEKLAGDIHALGGSAGGLGPEGAGLTGLREGTPVAVGNVDAHVTAAAAGAVDAGRMVAIMGTSTCHIMNGSVLREVPGMCGVVDGGIVPGLWGYEAGQSGVGDILGWFVDNLVPGRYEQAAAARGISVHDLLAELAAPAAVGAHGLVALDWQSGNRSVLVDHELSGLVVGLTLSSRPEEIYRALVEATAFGTRVIVETFEESGVPVEEFVAAGGLTRNRWLMQVYADVLGMPIRCVASGQGPALGSAIHAAVAAGAYADIRAAASAMARLEDEVISPDAERHWAYDDLFAVYRELHDHFGRTRQDVMRGLQHRRRTAVAP